MENICVWFCLLYVCTVYTPYLHTHRRCLRHVINLSYLFLFFSSQSPQHQTVLSIPAGTSFVNKSTRTTMIETVQKVYFGDEKWTCFRLSKKYRMRITTQYSKMHLFEYICMRISVLFCTGLWFGYILYANVWKKHTVFLREKIAIICGFETGPHLVGELV
jgi:hypothetical protein